ncbi:hypothetical protein COX95_03135 [bacterium CG_4_10_14_0_2_um_filter_33_32]|nr:MAG: hypothetical protein AUJ93_01345 [bacterium CG2_30_33_46]PIR67301.1 MAG: hypothetical protein COU50_04000 [bacterium CG10_big_fil_rev_8_21_14_0_10_33_18]PIU76684.1 MAG: hypothetical protein COS74_02710 [bacterium CG06_land_8_20_14_3_00_33_50]PIW80756.1 MAG: hypothetical protein COZ97_04580 [bacterium CG_4_8_14_3_um_filter_33_28]PIY85214.1 MAG: hypothetical protein COY76_03285 [bacterium CG_4_10_14_0_8_um_filter_33_57]PIZ85731.1 MAG: hypothetical protein COX95_03135 [bacterium CG_4_10_1
MLKLKEKNHRINSSISKQKLKYKAVIFDLGGVYYKNGVLTSFPILSKKYGLPQNYLLDIFNKKYVKYLEVGKLSEKDFWQKFQKDIGSEMKVKEIKNYIFKFFKPQPGMKNLLKKIRKKVKAGLLTNNLHEWYSYTERKGNLKSDFDAIVVSADVKIRKPNRKIYKLMADKLGVKTKECIFFDDLIENIQGARKANMKGIQFKSTEDVKNRLVKLGIL